MQLKRMKAIGIVQMNSKKAIDNALLTARPNGTRFIRRDLQRAELVMEIFEESPSMRIPTVISQLIASYLVHESTLKPRARHGKQTIHIKGKRDEQSVDKITYDSTRFEFDLLFNLTKMPANYL